MEYQQVALVPVSYDILTELAQKVDNGPAKIANIKHGEGAKMTIEKQDLSVGNFENNGVVNVTAGPSLLLLI